MLKKLIEDVSSYRRWRHWLGGRCRCGGPLPLGSDMAVAAEAGEGQQVLAVAVEVGQHLHPNMLADTP